MLESSDRDWAPVIDFFSARGIEIGLLVPTSTGLAKSILDATQIVRAAFSATDFHDYESQGKGQDHKRVVPAQFVQVDGNDETRASLYRPATKDGDPRIWFYKLKDYAESGNLLIIIPDGKQILVINASNPYLWRQIEEGYGHAGDLIRRRISTLSSTENELLGKLHEISMAGWHRTTKEGPTGVGMTLEELLGIPPNVLGTPDYKGIELKARRTAQGRRKSGLQTLFAKTPDWKLSPIRSATNLLRDHGYDSNGRRQLYCTVSAASATNGMGFWLEANPGEDELWCSRDIDEDRRRLMYWDVEILRRSLKNKHRATMWVSANSRRDDGAEYFHYHTAELTRSPIHSQLGLRLHDGTVSLDLTLSEKTDGKVRDHGYLFRCQSDVLHRVFPRPISFDLSDSLLEGDATWYDNEHECEDGTQLALDIFDEQEH